MTATQILYTVTRQVLLTTLALALLLTMTAGGFFAVRNRAADKLLPFLMARGSALSKQQADELEREVEADPRNFTDTIELLYFYSFKNELNPDELANRRKHILWVIANKSSSAFAGDSAMEFYPKDEESYP